MKIPCALLVSALLAVLGSASAQSITSVTGDGNVATEGSLGTQLDIVGTGFGGTTGLAKPAAFLVDPDTGKKFALKVQTFSDTEITALITKAAYGALNVTVQPKGGELLTALDPFTVPEPEVEPLTDPTGTIGTPVTITGTGLLGVVGLSKPKVQLFNPLTNKKYALKVTSFSDIQVVASISKAVAATMELQLVPKGGAPIVVSAAFVVPLPNISLVAPGFAYVNDTITLTCDHVGNKKPKVKVGTKTCKVVTFSDTGVTFLMPKKLAKGVQTLQLTNKVGTATQIGAIINQGDVPDVATSKLFSATLGKTKFLAIYPAPLDDLAVIAFFLGGTPPTVNISGIQADAAGLTQSGMTVLVPFDPATFTEPVAFIDVLGGKIEFQIPDPTQFPPITPLARWTSAMQGGTYSLTILSVEPAENGETLLRGAFSGTLVLDEDGSGGPGPYAPTLTVTNGEFRATVDLPG